MLRTHSSSKSPPRLKVPFELLALVFYIFAAGYTVTRCFIDHANFVKGHQAYQNSDCALAVTHFDNIINGWRLTDVYNYSARAQQKKSECLNLISAQGKSFFGETTSEANH
ncbi:MAG TPA: hypothetical protein V6D28_00385 [Leptolyngbyaceae cyanobacterium]